MPASRKSADDLLALHLASGLTVEHAADKAGVSRATAFRRLKDPAFRQRVRRQREEMIGRVSGLLTAGSVAAVAKLRHLVVHAQDEKTAMGAAKTILGALVGVRASLRPDELEERIAQLERAMEAEGNGDDEEGKIPFARKPA